MMTSQKRKSERAAASKERVEGAKRRKAQRDRERAAQRQGTDRFASLSFSLKLDRASEHIEDLRKATQGWLRTNAYNLVPDTNPKTGRTVIRADIREPPSPLLPIVLGDAVHNLRAALDHLVLELAVANHRPKAVPPGFEERSEFPIFQNTVGQLTGSDAFHQTSKAGNPVRTSGLYKLRELDPKAVKVIEGIQPYYRGAAYAEDPLWVIHELDRIDKHRRLNLTAYALGEAKLSIGEGFNEYLHIEHLGHNGPVKHGTPVAAFTARNTNYKLDFTREIALAEPSLPKSEFLVQAVTGLRDYIRDRVIPLLKPFL